MNKSDSQKLKFGKVHRHNPDPFKLHIYSEERKRRAEKGMIVDIIYQFFTDAIWRILAINQSPTNSAIYTENNIKLLGEIN